MHLTENKVKKREEKMSEYEAIGDVKSHPEGQA